MSYLKATENGVSYRFSLKEASDTTSGLFRSVWTSTHTSSNNSTLSFGNINYTSGKKYYFRVRFRGRGNGTPTSEKCSTICACAYVSDWSNSQSYKHSSAVAYSEIGQIVDWTWTMTANYTGVRTTVLFNIINGAWAQGYDNQTIDVYYYKFWDEDGKIYAEAWNPNENLFKYWYDGITAITSENTVETSLVVPKYLYSEKIPLSCITEGAEYTITFQAKKTSNCKSVDVRLDGNSSVTDIHLNVPVTTEYQQFSWSFTVRDNVNLYDKTLYYLQMNFVNNGSTDNTNCILYIKNVNVKLSYDLPKLFLKINKENILYYTNLWPISKNIIVRDNYRIRYLAQSVHEYTYSELAGFTYSELNKFEY